MNTNNHLFSIAKGEPLASEAGIGALTLPGFLREVVARYGTREVAVEYVDERALRWSYNDLWTRSLEVSKALLANGIGKGTRVGILMTNRLEFLSAVFGTAMAGGIATPLSTFSTAPELDTLLQLSACSVLLTESCVLKKDFVSMMESLDENFMSSLPGKIQSQRYPFLRCVAVLDFPQTQGSFEPWESFLARGHTVPPELVTSIAESVAPADPAVLFFSSGSTGKPKGILSANRGVCLQMWRWCRLYAYKDNVRSWSANGFFWSGNFALGLGACLSAGGSLILQRTFQPEDALVLMDKEKATFLFAWPHQWAQLTGSGNWQDVDLSSMYYIDKDSPIASHPTIQTDYKEPVHAYGNTETFTLSTVYPANTPDGEAKGSHGIPLAGNTIKIIDPLTGQLLPLGEAGEIAVKGPTLMLGYLGVPLTETLDDEGYFHTGDGGHLDEQGRLYWSGRLNDIIKTGGANVSPVEVDTVIARCPGVKINKTIGVPDELLGEKIVTCVVLHKNSDSDEQSVRAFAKSELASYKVPQRVLFVSECDLEMTGSAKVKVSELIDLAKQRFAEEAEPSC